MLCGVGDFFSKLIFGQPTSNPPPPPPESLLKEPAKQNATDAAKAGSGSGSGSGSGAGVGAEAKPVVALGNTSQKSGSGSAPQKKQYSWEKPRPDPKDYMFVKRTGEVLIREPGTINGLQFIIEHCDDCDIMLLDHMDQVTVDFCTNSRIFIGPINGSVFLRNLNNCQVIVACQQFR